MVGGVSKSGPDVPQSPEGIAQALANEAAEDLFAGSQGAGVEARRGVAAVLARADLSTANDDPEADDFATLRAEAAADDLYGDQGRRVA